MDAQQIRRLHGWVANHARKNYWRVAGWYELDDLIQDGLLLVYKCRNRYGEPGVDLDPPHFMALVKTTFHNHISDLIQSKHRDVAKTKYYDLAPQASEDWIIDHFGEAVEGEQEFSAYIVGLPAHLKRAVEFCFSEFGAKKLRNLRVRLDRADDSITDCIRKYVGFPEGRDFETELRAYMWADDVGVA